ncbi:MAG TPA: hypothetical protein VM889_12235 [Candidatus Thermoplasmatota archaeon]|nr:hypothetical protein [Candidatus Thermoplasmatota archaeon]
MTRRLYRIAVRPGEEGTFRKAAVGLTEDVAREVGLDRFALFYQGSTAWLLLEGAVEEPAKALFESSKTRKAAEAMAAHSDFSADRAASLAVAETFHEGAAGAGIPLAFGLRILPGHAAAFRAAALGWRADPFLGAGASEAALFAGDEDAFLVVGAPDAHFVERLVGDPAARRVLADIARHTDLTLSDPSRDALVEVHHALDVSRAW